MGYSDSRLIYFFTPHGSHHACRWIDGIPFALALLLIGIEGHLEFAGDMGNAYGIVPCPLSFCDRDGEADPVYFALEFAAVSLFVLPFTVERFPVVRDFTLPVLPWTDRRAGGVDATLALPRPGSDERADGRRGNAESHRYRDQQ